jgi:hypothetical protein
MLALFCTQDEPTHNRQLMPSIISPYWFGHTAQYAKIAQVLAVELCWQCRLIQAQTSIHLLSPRIYLSVCLTIVLSTDTQKWHDYDAFQLSLYEQVV